jgi:RNase P subunit RPR2
MLKGKVSELRIQCEELKKLHLENEKKALVCSECGKPIAHGQEVTVRDSAGTERSYYHKECFQALWL